MSYRANVLRGRLIRYYIPWFWYPLWPICGAVIEMHCCWMYARCNLVLWDNVISRRMSWIISDSQVRLYEIRDSRLTQSKIHSVISVSIECPTNMLMLVECWSSTQKPDHGDDIGIFLQIIVKCVCLIPPAWILHFCIYTMHLKLIMPILTAQAPFEIT